MRIFWIRFCIFCIFWAFLIFQESMVAPVSIIFFAIAMACYFLVSLQKMTLVLFLLISALLIGNSIYFVDGLSFTILLLLYLMIDSSFRMNDKDWMIYSIVNLAFTLILIWIYESDWLQWLSMSLLFYFLVMAVNRMSNERSEQRGVYEELLGEYRKLKRMNLDSERDARLHERTIIAREIHDSVGHRLTALLMKLEMLRIQRPGSDFDELKVMANESLEDIRRSVKTLQTEDNEGIATVVHLIRKLEAESHMVVHFTIKQGILSVPLSNEKSVVLYRVIQEALTNAMRHAGSREVHITLGKSAIGDISFEITNPVFQPKPLTYGFGLRNMKARIDEIDGSLEVYQTEGQFVVNGTIPSKE